LAVTRFEIRAGAYFDSVILMQLQRSLAGLPGVVDAGVVMATAANRSLLAEGKLLPEDANAGSDDLLIVIKADQVQTAEAALSQVDALLAQRRSVSGGDYRPRSLDAAVKLLPEAGWVLISVPGRYAAAIARDALTLDRHVFLYSDNVSLEDEVDLKRIAAGKGLLVMGPDCGTALINGIGFGFANRVRQGTIGLVSASGTGLQAVSVRIHARGAGVSQALGTGGRDLQAAVGGLTALQGLNLLANDPETKVIVVVSKPPDSTVAARLAAAARMIPKPVIFNFIGYSYPEDEPVDEQQSVGSGTNVHFRSSLVGAADLAVLLADKSGGPQAAGLPTPVSRPYLRALFSGGTLAYEALLGLRAFLSPVSANISLPGILPLENPARSAGHTVLDLGADEFTVGRLHPMIDNDLRLRRLRQESADKDVGLILLDVVLGEGAHPDPAGELAPAIAAVVHEAAREVVVVLIGTDEDPQDLDEQLAQLQAAGAQVFLALGPAIAYCLSRLAGPDAEEAPLVKQEGFKRPVAAINVGLETFYDSLTEQGARAIQVEWRPPAGGDDRLMALLEKMKG
jgi:FdrA protein